MVCTQCATYLLFVSRARKIGCKKSVFLYDGGCTCVVFVVRPIIFNGVFVFFLKKLFLKSFVVLNVSK